MIDRVHRELTDEEIERIAKTYRLWRGDPHPVPLPLGEGGRRPGEVVAEYRDIPGFCRSATTEEIVKHGSVLTPGRYVGVEEVEEEEGAFEEKMAELTKRLYGQIRESRELEEQVKANLARIGFGGDHA